MPKALSVHRAIVPSSDRTRYVERLKVRKEHYVRAGCKFWVFEEAALPGAFIEFTEAVDAATLTKAHVGAPESMLDPSRIYTEVELT